MHACSAPPIYWSIGIQYLAFSLSKISLPLSGSQYLKKYHEELTKVSIVSVSLLASFLHFGHFVLIHSSFVASGFPSPNVTFFGSIIGKSFSGTGTAPIIFCDKCGAVPAPEKDFPN